MVTKTAHFRNLTNISTVWSLQERNEGQEPDHLVSIVCSEQSVFTQCEVHIHVPKMYLIMKSSYH